MWPVPTDNLNDETAILETDVMRFLAILAICLLIVFALVNQAASTLTVDQAIEPEPPAPQWKLVFESDAALMHLMSQNRVELYVREDGRWHRVTRHGSEAVTQLEAEMFAMPASTVPKAIRGRPSFGLDVDWYVRLDAALRSALQTQLSESTPRTLVIQGSGDVTSVSEERP